MTPQFDADGRVMLRVRVDPVDLDTARAAALNAGMNFGLWLERAMRRAAAAESVARATAATHRGESDK